MVSEKLLAEWDHKRKQLSRLKEGKEAVSSVAEYKCLNENPVAVLEYLLLLGWLSAVKKWWQL